MTKPIMILATSNGVDMGHLTRAGESTSYRNHREEIAFVADGKETVITKTK